MSVTEILIAFGIVLAIAAVLGSGVAVCTVFFPRGEKKPAEKKAEKKEKKYAVVRCKGADVAHRFTYDGVCDCNVANMLSAGPIKCVFGCLGYGTCINVCPEGAISVEGGVAKIDRAKCTGCGACEGACPRGIITLVPEKTEHVVLCSSNIRASELRRNCEAGCIGCMLCVKTCKYGAITVTDRLASIDYTLCTGCGECADVCTRSVISTPKKKEEVVIEEEMDETAYLKAVIEEAKETEVTDESDE